MRGEVMDQTEVDFIGYSFHIKEIHSTAENTCPPKDRIIRIQLFSIPELFGSYFSCIYRGMLRIHIVFNKDNNEYNDEITKLIKETLEQTNISEGKMWISNQNNEIVAHLKKEFRITLDSEPFLYESHELIMPRHKFHYKFDDTTLEIKPYQEEYIDKYLLLLYNAMSFKIPPYNYLLKKVDFMNEFRDMEEKGLFEAFWIKDDLVGLYWISGTEIDHIAVSEQYQHLGYAKQILTRAIEVLFQNPDVEYAWLLVVEWNSKAYNFYKKFGMEEKAVYHVP